MNAANNMIDPNTNQPSRSTGLFLLGILLSAATVRGEAVLDWTAVTWNNGDLENTYILSNGVTVEIKVTATAAGNFNNTNPPVTSPYIDSKGSNPKLFGSSIDLGVIFNPNPGQAQSPVLIEVSFSPSVTNLVFEISDIDFSPGGGGEDDRLDQVVITSDAGDPTLEYLTSEGDATYTVVGNMATAKPSRGAGADMDNGTVRVRVPDGVTTVTITYNEASGNDNPAGRGIGLLAMFTETPVELQSFSIE